MRYVLAALLLAGCAMTPDAARRAGVDALCAAAISGDRESARVAVREIELRGWDPRGCGAVYAAQQQRAMTLMGLGAGILISSQPQQPQQQNCVSAPLGGGAYSTSCR